MIETFHHELEITESILGRTEAETWGDAVGKVTEELSKGEYKGVPFLCRIRQTDGLGTPIGGWHEIH